MANFCTQCGSALQEGSAFCTGCGTPVGGITVQVASPTQPAAIQPQAANPVKVILIIVVVIAGIGILTGAALFLGVWKLSRTVKVDSRNRVSIATPMGNMTLGSSPVSEADVGAPLYPNAQRDEGNIQISTAEGSMSTYVFKTSDSPAQVLEFYRNKLGSNAAYVTTPEGGMITSAKGEKEGFMITVGRDEGKTVITIIRGRSPKAP